MYNDNLTLKRQYSTISPDNMERQAYYGFTAQDIKYCVYLEVYNGSEWVSMGYLGYMAHSTEWVTFYLGKER